MMTIVVIGDGGYGERMLAREKRERECVYERKCERERERERMIMRTSL
jgi:hypothetical protein